MKHCFHFHARDGEYRCCWCNLSKEENIIDSCPQEGHGPFAPLQRVHDNSELYAIKDEECPAR